MSDVEERVKKIVVEHLSVDEILDCLAQLSLMSAVDGDPSGSKAERDPEQVTLSSVHQAKGLEWKIVFVISLTDGMFPNGRVLDADDEYMLEEERRLFYVAITRAEERLFWCNRYALARPVEALGIADLPEPVARLTLEAESDG